ncbi:MAG: patatin-like phospholipase family protein [Desulfobacteraceae bacterium]|nr:patatin-like phospholipase family protein [Desulfobacteraceae bacterium]
MKTNRKILIIVFILSALLLSGCATSYKRNPLPEAYGDIAQIPYIPYARFWGDSVPSWFQEKIDDIKEQIRQSESDTKNISSDYLAISGGGANGAFGAGLLFGWTTAGDRPEFRIVSGISTGALMAPFAFLGAKYDVQLKKLYTTKSTKDILEKRSLFSILTGDSASDTTPMREMLEDVIDVKMLEDIIVEHDKGRRLFIGTTNLDANRPVIWNIGIIAKSGAPNALELVREILLASVSIPGLFPPVYIEVEADGRRYDEIHVDGGASSQVFLYPVSLDMRRMMRQVGLKGKSRIYVIRNSRIEPEWETTKPKILPILYRTASSLIRTQGIGDLYRIYLKAQRDGMDYNLAFIPSDFKEKPKEEFDPEYMNKLFDLGYQMARNDYPWEKAPPGFESK